jgi:ribosomal protein S24E
MANYFASLPAYKNPDNAELNFNPLNQAVQNFGETSRANAMAEYAAGRNKVADGRAAAQESRAARKFSQEEGKDAINQMAGIYQAIEAAPEAERPMMLQRAKPMFDKLRAMDPEWDQDAQDAGLDPNDYAGSKLVIGRAAGYQDPRKVAEAPSNVREWDHFNRLTPEQKQQYLTMKRADKYLDTGTGYTQPNPIAPGENIRTVPKDIAGAKAAEKVGAATGEAQASLAAIQSKMPGLEAVVRQLDELSEKATYTTAGKTVDVLRREMGAEPRESAVARKQYISMVDNQILPLLRDTFGAQFTQKEGESLKATLGDPDASPKEKQAVLKAFIEQKRRNVEATAAEAGSSPAAPASTQPTSGFKYLGTAP